MAQHPVITVDESGRSVDRKPGGWLRSRRMVMAGGLALVEVLLYHALDPPRWIAILLVGAALAGCIALTGRMRSGLARDLVLIVALAQALLIALPILIGFVSLVVATVAVLLLIALFVIIGLRFRR